MQKLITSSLSYRIREVQHKECLMNNSGVWSRRITMLILTLISLGIWFAIQRIDILKFIQYPLDQFYVLWHEGGHSLAGAITGGNILEMVIFPGLGGHALIQNGNFALFSPAGYVGAAIVGSVFYFVTNAKPELSDFWAFVYGLFVITTTSVFATSDPVIRSVSIFFAMSFITIAALAKQRRWLFELIAVALMILCSVIVLGIDRNSTTNLTFIIGMLTGGVLIIVGSAGKVLLSLVILNVFNIALMFNVYVRTSGLISSTFVGSHDDAAQYAARFGLDPQNVARGWFAIAMVFFIFFATSAWLWLGRRKKA